MSNAFISQVENLRFSHHAFVLGFPRDGTNRDGTSRCPFVPGQKMFLVPVSLCPGTRAGANVPGQTPLSRDVPGQNKFKKLKE